VSRIGFQVLDATQPVAGDLRYERPGHSFDFHPAEAATRRQLDEAVELAFGSMAVPVERETLTLLGVWGYHPDAGWLTGSLGTPRATAARLHATLPGTPPRGVALRLVRLGDLTTIRDPRTGWVRVGRTGVPTGTHFVEFATGCLTELADGDLIALWLRPTTTEPTAPQPHETSIRHPEPAPPATPAPPGTRDDTAGSDP
jgi:hypothetical protein